MAGLAWVYWSLGLSLYVSDTALLARAAVGQRREKRDPDAVPNWLDGLSSRNSFLVRPLRKVYDVYSRTDSWAYCALIWAVAEIVFPWVILLPVLLLVFLLGLVLLGLRANYSAWIGSAWGFGQLLPMFLIILPFYQLAETFCGKYQHSARY